jgi:type I restriction enzyme S subunit
VAESEMQSRRTLPDGWMWVSVDQIGSVKGGKRLPKGHTYSEARTAYPYIRVTDFQGMTVNLETLRYLRPDTQRLISRYTISKNDVYISIAGSIGKTGVIPDCLDDANLTENAAKISDLAGFSNKLLSYFLSAPYAQSQIARFTVSSNQPKLALFRIKKIEIPLPPLPEQRRIVAEIETQFTRLDAGVAALERAQANLKRYRASVLKAACEGRLVPTEAELARRDGRDYEPDDQLLTRILAERRARWEAEHPGKKYKEPVLPDTERLPELPEGWGWTSLEILASDRRYAISSGPFGSALGTKDYRENGIPVIRGKNVADGQLILENWVHVSKEKAARLERSMARPDDLIVVAVGSSGRAAIVPESLPKAILSQNCNKITPDTNVILPKYLVLSMQIGIIQKQLEQKTTDTVRKFLSLTNLRKTLIPLPPLPEQRRIVAEVERRLSVVAALEAEVEAALARAARLRQSILKRAFEGRLLDPATVGAIRKSPDYEPASALLARIKAEREAAAKEKGGHAEQLPLPGT